MDPKMQNSTKTQKINFLYNFSQSELYATTKHISIPTNLQKQLLHHMDMQNESSFFNLIHNTSLLNTFFTFFSNKNPINNHYL